MQRFFYLMGTGYIFWFLAGVIGGWLTFDLDTICMDIKDVQMASSISIMYDSLVVLYSFILGIIGLILGAITDIVISWLKRPLNAKIPMVVGILFAIINAAYIVPKNEWDCIQASMFGSIVTGILIVIANVMAYAISIRMAGTQTGEQS